MSEKTSSDQLHEIARELQARVEPPFTIQWSQYMPGRCQDEDYWTYTDDQGIVKQVSMSQWRDRETLRLEGQIRKFQEFLINTHDYDRTSELYAVAEVIFNEEYPPKKIEVGDWTFTCPEDDDRYFVEWVHEGETPRVVLRETYRHLRIAELMREMADVGPEFFLGRQNEIQRNLKVQDSRQQYEHNGSSWVIMMSLLTGQKEQIERLKAQINRLDEDVETAKTDTQIERERADRFKVALQAWERTMNSIVDIMYGVDDLNGEKEMLGALKITYRILSARAAATEVLLSAEEIPF